MSEEKQPNHDEVEVIQQIEINEDYMKIIQANASVRTIDVKGKEYAEVNQRIKAFRQVHPLGNIRTEIEKLEAGVVVMKAIITDNQGKTLGTGYAYEKEGSSFINKTSYIENCETSAVGRALGMCGYGIETSVCSYEELQNVINNQKKEAPAKEIELSGTKVNKNQIIMIQELYSEDQIQKMLKNLNVDILENLPIEHAREMVMYKK